MQPRAKKAKCKYYDSETGDPDPKPCPRSSKVCWFIHPNEPEWSEKGGGGGGGKRLSSPPRRYGRGRKRSSSPRRGRGRSRSRSRSRVRTRSRTRSRSNGRHKSPGRRRPRPSSPPPPRRPLYERIQRSHSPRPRLRSNSRPRSYSPHRRPRDRRPSMRTPTPISSSRGHTPPRYSKSDRPSLKVKLESSTDPVSSVLSNSSRPALGDTNTSVVGDQPPIPPRASVDRHHQEPTLSLTLGERATATSGSTQPPSPQTEPHSPVFGPETPVIPGLSSSVQFTQPQITAISALQKSLELVIRDQATMRPSTTPPVGSSTASHPATVPDGGRTEIWTTRVKLWADLMKAKSEVMEWQDEVELAQSFKNRAGFDAFSPEAQAQVNSRISYATGNLVQHQLAFEALISQSIALDQSVSNANAALTPAPAVPDPRAATPREIEWMQERIQAATARADELEKKLALQDQLLERLKAEQEAVAALPSLPSASRSRSSMEIDDGDGILDGAPSLKRKRTDDDELRPPSRRKTLARNVADLQEANEALVDRIAEAEGTIEGILNDAVEDPEGEESSRAIRLKEIFQDYQTFIENAKTAVEATERNSQVVEVLKTEAERAIADWSEAYQEFEVVRNEAMEIQAREKKRAEEFAKKEEEIASMQREIEALSVTVQAFVEQQSAQPEEVLTLEQAIEALRPVLTQEMQEATQPLLTRKHDELQRMLTDHIEAVRVSIYEPITLSEQVARTMVTWLEAEFGFGTTKR